MARRGRGDGWDDYEMEKRMQESEDRRAYGDDSVLLTFIGIGVAFALLLGGLGWMDAQFGWGTVDWFKGIIGMD